ncbi:hypothetical protein CK203_089813 [Vitis vinifera]|uniref:Uncharacterized protein n=1 Tax=Vitis vinifera TaxID=29760 RepID=A0A438D3E7_VITVI|nr:hypothetical protein CK203_089813 [Vitis vinifera]
MGERGDGREERERWSEFEERCGEVELHCRWLLRWQWLSGVLKIGGLKKNVIGMKRHRLFDEVGLSFYIENVVKCHVVSNYSTPTTNPIGTKNLAWCSISHPNDTHKQPKTRYFGDTWKESGPDSAASSRYSPATVFNGPVRRWKKKWVHVSSSSSSTVSYHNSQSNGHNSNTGSRLLLCKWTPLTSGDAERSFGKPEEPPRRKFRYTPVSFHSPKLQN